MSENSPIEWCHHTFNPWWGCTKVGPGCDHCYAEALQRRLSGRSFGTMWGVDAKRNPASERSWAEPRKWNEKAQQRGTSYRVFCASMADVFDVHPTAETLRPRLWDLIRETPYLTWLLLTKRIGNAHKMLPTGNLPSNLWIGATVCNQDEIDRDLPKLAAIDARVRFLSIEPLLDRVVLPNRTIRSEPSLNSLVDWVIVGGETGNGARAMELEWVRSIRRQCDAAGIPLFVKQLGRYPQDLLGRPGFDVRQVKDRKGAAVREWPVDLRVREFPA